MADSVDDVWLSDVETATLVDSSGRLAPYADLALLVGARTLRATHLLSSNSQYSSSLVRLAGAVCRLDTGIALPAPRSDCYGARAETCAPERGLAKQKPIRRGFCELW